MRGRRLLGLVATAAVLVVAAGCGGGSSSSGSGGESGSGPHKGGILTIGTTNYIDSLNPFHYIESQSTNAMIMIYPQLVQYAQSKDDPNKLVLVGDWADSWTHSADGKDWTFKLKPDTKWSDGKPMTAEDAAWTINTTVKYANGPTAVAAAGVAHVKSAEATDPTTLVIHYDGPVGNALEQLETFFILPEHQWKPLVGSNGAGLKSFAPQEHLDTFVTGGAYTIQSFEKKGKVVFRPNPNYYGTPSNADAVVLQFYTNADAMIADLEQGTLQWVDQVPFEAINDVKKQANLKLNIVPGAETTNITWNSNPYKTKNRELLDPKVKQALSECVDRQKIIDVVFSGYATTVESIVGHISGDMENPDLGPTKYDCDAANQTLDQLGYKKGSDGIRVAPATTGQYAQSAHPMKYEILQPTSLDFNGERAFDVVKEGFAKLGVDVTLNVAGDATAAYAVETGDTCDGTKNPPVGYDGFDIAMWDWIGYVDPDFMLSVVTRDQWCSWSDTGWINADYDKLYNKQGVTVDRDQRKQIAYQMQQMVYDEFVYTQLVNEEYVDANAKTWTNFKTILNAYSKEYYTSPYKVS
ncbi:MAG: ABC transporter substrate-binding protein [Gaiellales bacterium]